MSDIKRAYDLLRGYVNHEWDRMRSIDFEKAWNELNSPAQPSASETAQESSDAPSETPSTDPKEVACNILGVAKDGSFEDIKKAFDKLNKRCNPANFPEGSDEANNAAKIQARVNWAYRILTDDKPEIEKRFKSLEID